MKAWEVKKIAKECGIDLAGIASRDRLTGMPDESNPLKIQPKAKSVIVLGYQVLRGALRGMEVGSCWNAFGGGSPFSVMVENTYNFCRKLESDGWECVPLHNMSSDLRKQGVAVAAGKVEPDVIVDMELLAYLAGLGQIGEGKFFLTPEFGPRQVFMAVVTELELPGDPLQTEEVCDHCGECIRACPALSYDTKNWNKVSLAAGEQKWRPIRHEVCRVCKTGITGNPYDSGAEPNRLGAACGRACVAHLEASGRLKNSLKSPFREPGN